MIIVFIEWSLKVIKSSFLIKQMILPFLHQHQKLLTRVFIFDIIGKKLQLPKETEPPSTKMGLLHGFNGLDINQCQEYIEISCPGSHALLIGMTTLFFQNTQIPLYLKIPSTKYMPRSLFHLMEALLNTHLNMQTLNLSWVFLIDPFQLSSCLLMIVVFLTLDMPSLLFPSFIHALLNSIINTFKEISPTFNTQRIVEYSIIACVP